VSGDSNTMLGEALLVGLAGLVADVSAQILEVPPEVAKVLADEIATRFSDQFGGDQLYIPKGRVFRTSAIYREMYTRFTGHNQRELAKEFGFSIIHTYRVLARERERDRVERQSAIPGL
jgi:Mor family transcriptional regulator